MVYFFKRKVHQRIREANHFGKLLAAGYCPFRRRLASSFPEPMVVLHKQQNGSPLFSQTVHPILIPGKLGIVQPMRINEKPRRGVTFFYPLLFIPVAVWVLIDRCRIITRTNEPPKTPAFSIIRPDRLIFSFGLLKAVRDGCRPLNHFGTCPERGRHGIDGQGTVPHSGCQRCCLPSPFWMAFVHRVTVGNSINPEFSYEFFNHFFRVVVLKSSNACARC